MATTYSYLETKVSELGTIIHSTDGQGGRGPAIYLSVEEARRLGARITKQLGQPKQPQRSSAPQRSTVPARRSAPTTQRKAASNKVVGTLQFVGKSNFIDSQWEYHARNLAKSRAEKKYRDYMKSLAYEGKAWDDCRATGQHILDGKGNVTYLIKATLG